MHSCLAGGTSGGRRTKGYIRKRGGSYQVLVCSGPDPLTGKDVYLTESASTLREAERIKARLVAQVDAQRTTATRVTLAYTLEAWFEVRVPVSRPR